LPLAALGRGRPGLLRGLARLRGLTASRAATVQLSVPVIAAVGGVLLLAEPLTLRLVLASAATLGGIAIVLAQKTRRRRL
jgi:drug/metabolite transporter (DMT)-like permease